MPRSRSRLQARYVFHHRGSTLPSTGAGPGVILRDEPRLVPHPMYTGIVSVRLQPLVSAAAEQAIKIEQRCDMAGAIEVLDGEALASEWTNTPIAAGRHGDASRMGRVGKSRQTAGSLVRAVPP